ncbi:hypothetical protein [Nocardiopsis dassonvillei]|uniref:hypothetical protein n=1 Tax=Nocardiopsis dassonvillei TaxID=2014 RepID=UPI0033C9E2A0
MQPHENELITLKEWAQRCGYSHGYVVHVMPRYYPDFPAPERTRHGATDKGGGGGSNLYDPAKLAPFEPRGTTPVELAEEDLNKQVTLGGFAALVGVNVKSVVHIKNHRPDTLPPTIDGQRHWYPQARYYARDLLLMWNSRPGRGRGSDKRRPPLPWQAPNETP